MVCNCHELSLISRNYLCLCARHRPMLHDRLSLGRSQGGDTVGMFDQTISGWLQAHLIKNRKSQVAEAMGLIKTRKKVRY